VSDDKVRVNESFDRAILDERRRLVEDYEHLARRSSAYRSAPLGDWKGTVPVALAASFDVVRAGGNFVSSSAELSGDLAAGIERGSVSVDQLMSSNADAALIAANKAVGDTFELEVQDLIRRGELAVPEGTASVELMGRTNEGFDFRFTNDTGEVIGLMNTKASSSHEIIARHFEAHPDVNYVYVTSEAADSAARAGYTVVDGVNGVIPVTDQPIVVRTGVSDGEYRADLAEFMAPEHSGLAGWFDGEGVLESVPWVTAGLLAFRSVRRHRGGMSFRENKVQTYRDATRSGVAYGAAVVLQGAGVPLPVTMIGSMFSVATVNGVFTIRDEWGDLAAQEETLARRVEFAEKGL